MTVEEVLELRRQGRTEEAYEAMRLLYAADKGASATAGMFWAALDMLQLKAREQQFGEARKIYLALERVLARMDDDDGLARNALDRAKRLLNDHLDDDSSKTISAHTLLGRWGEEQAADYLRRNGYTILERDWHSKHRDIDIIALDDDTLVFVEVKTRRNADFGNPEEAVGYWKQHNLRLAINHYLNYHQTDRPWRFDVIAVVGTIGSAPAINHIKDFTLSMR